MSKKKVNQKKLLDKIRIVQEKNRKRFLDEVTKYLKEARSVVVSESLMEEKVTK